MNSAVRLFNSVFGIVCWAVAFALLSIMAQSSQGLPQTWSTVEQAHVADGFKLEHVYDVANSQGSWVSLAVDPQGRMIASDQDGMLYRIAVDAEKKSVAVEPINVRTGRAHGLLCAFDSLYVMSHRGDGQPSGLYRVRDTNNDDQYDTVELLVKMEGDGEHGPHAIVLSPDGKSLYLCGGNHTKVPPFETSRVPQIWQEDQVLPRLWDPNGHAVNIMAPGGWVVQCDPDGKNIDLVSIGYRNQYDIAFNPEGELFTFDADMEWDIGLPWYRPTRVCHVTSGSEFGWRSGTGKWPSYYPDSLPAVMDIGPASPTGVSFGTGAGFPEKYKRALFVADWSYGVIYAMHLRPQGASFAAERETLVSGPGMAVTDMVVNPVDGAMYFLIGGRKSRSAMFRVSWAGAEAESGSVEITGENDLHQLRRELELLHGEPVDSADQVVARAWPQMGHADRHIRFAARAAIERMPFGSWKGRALDAAADEGLSVTERINWALASVRCGDDAAREAAIQAMLKIDWNSLETIDQLSMLRVIGLGLARSGAVDDSVRSAICQALEPAFPARDSRCNAELCRLLVAAKSASVVEPAMTLMEQAPTQEQQIHFFYCLGNATVGWTPELRDRYFQWYLTTGSMRGGNSFAKFISNIRDVAIANLDAGEKSRLEGLLAQAPERADPVPVVSHQKREFVRKWAVADMEPLGDNDLASRNLENGRAMFLVGQCYQCHRLDGEGGSVGPDLTPAGRRFITKDLLETMIEPNKAISDQYQAMVFQLDDGRVVTGRIANLNNQTYMIQTNMLDPGNFTRIDTPNIVGMRPSTVSMMPEGLLDTMTRDDVMDLVAFLRSVADNAAGVAGNQPPGQ